MLDGDLDANWIESMNSAAALANGKPSMIRVLGLGGEGSSAKVMDDSRPEHSNSSPAHGLPWGFDCSRLLTLPSNERIPLKATGLSLCRYASGWKLLDMLSSVQMHMKMIFEIRDLNYATPATATRAGIARSQAS